MKKVFSILGSIIGAIIFSIPWIFSYVYLNYMVVVLASLIGFGALWFYKLFKGEVNKNTVYVIIIASFIAITLSTFVIIPLMLMAKENIIISFSNFKNIYSLDNFLSSLIGDYIISLLFTILGISGIIRSIKNKDNKDNINNKEYLVEDVKKIYEEYNAFSKDKAIKNDILVKRVSLKRLNELEREGYIITKLNKSYFDLNAETSNEVRLENIKKCKKKNSIIIIIFILIFIVAFWIFFLIDDENNDNSNNNNNQEQVEEKQNNIQVKYKDISISLPNTFKLSEKKDNYVYYTNSDYNSILNEVMLEQVEYDELDSFNYLNNYKNALEEDFSFLETNDEEEIYLLKSLKYENEYYMIKVKILDKKVYIISLFSYIENNSYYEDNINLFKKINNIYLKSVKYKNNSNNI